METRKEKVRRLFEEGYNCSQAVFGAYCDFFGMEESVGLQVSAALGGGVGRMREVCGAVTGMALLVGLAMGEGTNEEGKKRKAYEKTQEMAKAFQSRSGGNSIVCRELLSGAKVRVETTPAPDARTAEYYKKRPCLQLVETAADIVEEYLLKEGSREVTNA